MELKLKHKINSTYSPVQRQSTWDTVPKAFLAVLVILRRVWHFALASILSQVGVSWKFSSTCFKGIRFLRDIRMVLRELKEAFLLNLSGTGLSFSSKSARSWCFRQPIVALTFLSTDTISVQVLINLFLKRSEYEQKLEQSASVRKRRDWISHTAFPRTSVLASREPQAHQVERDLTASFSMPHSD